MGPAARPGWRVSVKGELRLGLQGFNTTCSPLTRVGRATAIKLRWHRVRWSAGGLTFGLVVSVKEKFFQRARKGFLQGQIF
jgi:hypothetical protein